MDDFEANAEAREYLETCDVRYRSSVAERIPAVETVCEEASLPAAHLEPPMFWEKSL